jgi:hypothetical protein
MYTTQIKSKDIDKNTHYQDKEYCSCEFIKTNLFDHRDRKASGYDCFDKHYTMCKQCGKQMGFSYYKLIDDMDEVNKSVTRATWRWLLLARKHALEVTELLPDDNEKEKYAQYLNFLFRSGERSIHLILPD